MVDIKMTAGSGSRKVSLEVTGKPWSDARGVSNAVGGVGPVRRSSALVRVRGLAPAVGPTAGVIEGWVWRE